MKKINSYKFRIYPTREQEEQLFKTIGSARKVYNLLLSEYESLYEKHKGDSITKDEYSLARKRLNHAVFSNDDNYSYLKEVDSTALKYAHKHINRAYSNFFAGVSNKPVYKSKIKNKWSYSTCRASKKSKNLRLEKGGKLKLPKIPGYVKTVVSRNPKGILVSATITKTRSSKWFVALGYETNTTEPLYKDSMDELYSPIGIDMGVKDLVITSSGVVYSNDKVGYKHKEKIARLDKKLSRKREQAKKDNRKLSESKNYQKTKIKRARAYEKIVNVRQDTLHKMTTNIVKNHDFIGIEYLSSSNLLKNHNLAFAISDASWNAFFTALEYKAKDNGVILCKIDRFYASTQTCSACLSKTGTHLKGFDGLKHREWTCLECGAKHDRDINAAYNILREALKNHFTVGTTGFQ